MAAYTAVDDPEKYFQAVIWTGNGSANNAITLPGDSDMQPDMVWIKNRDATDGHCLFDSTRGATKLLDPAETSAETTDTDTLDSFTSDGFQVDADDKVNTNTEKYVAWCWKGGTTAVPSGGSITPSAVSFSATAGIGIYKHTGTDANGTIAHGLGVAPKWLIYKNTERGAGWQVGHTSLGFNKVAYLNTYAAPDTSSTPFNDTAPSTTLLTLGGDGDSGTNKDGEVMVGYAFAEVQGFSKMSTYTGTGNADGTFVYLGFRPAYIMLKYHGGAGYNWKIYDSKRDSYNGLDANLDADTTDAEPAEANMQIDLVSNGFKIRSTNSNHNNSGYTYHYMAFAEAPFVNSNGVPCNAR